MEGEKTNNEGIINKITSTSKRFSKTSLSHFTQKILSNVLTQTQSNFKLQTTLKKESLKLPIF